MCDDTLPFLLTRSYNMKIIEITQNKFVVVDDEDYDYLSSWKWYYSRSGYAVRNNAGHQVLMHRVIMNMVGSARQIDHINRNKLDNRKSNLRIANDSQNQANTTKKNTNTSGYKGVSLNKQTGRFTAQITVNKKRIHLGYFDDAYSAAKAYDKQAKFHFGDYAEVNFN